MFCGDAVPKSDFVFRIYFPDRRVRGAVMSDLDSMDGYQWILVVVYRLIASERYGWDSLSLAASASVERAKPDASVEEGLRGRWRRRRVKRVHSSASAVVASSHCDCRNRR